MSSVPLSFLNHVAGEGDPRVIVNAAIDSAVTAERTGYDTFWVTQHHFGSERGVVGSPLALLAAIAQRTSRIRLGTAVVLLSIEHAHRIAEDALLVDLLSSGRLKLGVSAGGHPHWLAQQHIDEKQRHERYQRKLATLRGLLRDDPRAQLSSDGRPLWARIYQAVSTPERAFQAARQGDGLLLGRQPRVNSAGVDETSGLVGAYRNGGGKRVVLTRTIWPEATKERALEGLRLGIDYWGQYLASRGRDWLQQTLNADTADPLADAARELKIAYGDDDALLRFLEADDVLNRHADELAVQFQPGFPDGTWQNQALAHLAALLPQLDTVTLTSASAESGTESSREG